VLCIRKCLELGLEAALGELPRAGDLDNLFNQVQDLLVLLS
jgi:hypothetical protein